jgi:hypothetical protein
MSFKLYVFIQQQNMLGLNAKQHGHVNHLNHAQSPSNHDIILHGHCVHSPRTIRTALTAPQLVKKFPTFFFLCLQQPISDPCPEPEYSSTHSQNLLL